MQPGTISAIPGVTAAELYTLGTDTLIDTADTVVPGTSDPSHYLITFSGVAAGDYRLVLKAGSIVAGIEPKVTVSVNSWTVASSGAGLDAAGVRAAVGLAAANLDTQLGTITSKTNLLGTGAVAVVALVTPTGDIASPIVIGDDYLEANSRAFEWLVPAVPGVVAATAQFYFGGKPITGGPGWLVLGEVSDAGGGNWRVSAELPRTATQSLSDGLYRWSGEIRDASGNEVTRIRSDSNRHVQLVQKQT